MTEQIARSHTYRVGHITFIVTPVYPNEQGETIFDIRYSPKADESRCRAALTAIDILNMGGQVRYNYSIENYSFDCRKGGCRETVK